MSQPGPEPVDGDDDPIAASYQVFVNPALPLGRRLLVLQHPNRTDAAPRPPPAELRLKEHSGMVEFDVPLDSTAAYDREKGLRWGRTLQDSMAVKSGSSHGLAGGFGFGAVQQRAPRKRPDPAAAADDAEILDWNEAVRQGKVLSTQTLGGQYPDADEVQYMVGVFQGKDLHLTPVSSLVHLRPQLHHLDAAAQLQRQSAASASKEGALPPVASARAIHMTVKATADGDGVTTETMADRLRSVQTEPWRKMPYTDENDEAAWDVYNESLFLRPKLEGEEAAKAAEKALEELVPKLATSWGDEQFLQAVSGIKKPVSGLEPPAVVKPEPGAKAVPPPSRPEAEQAQRPKVSRPRGGAAAGRGGRAKTATS